MGTWQVAETSDIKFDLVKFFASYNRTLTETGTDYDVYFYDPSYVAHAFLDSGHYKKFEFLTTSDSQSHLDGTLTGVDVDATLFQQYYVGGDFTPNQIVAFLFSGADTLTGSAKADVLRGFTSADIIIGAGGADDLYGGTGADQFSFADISESGKSVKSQDEIFDFKRRQSDLIDLHLIDAKAGKPNDQDFSFIGSAAFDKHAGQLRYVAHEGSVTVYGDVNGDGKADFSVLVDHNTKLIQSDFIL